MAEILGGALSFGLWTHRKDDHSILDGLAKHNWYTDTPHVIRITSCTAAS
jgi:hypothetical protein